MKNPGKNRVQARLRLNFAALAIGAMLASLNPAVHANPAPGSAAGAAFLVNSPQGDQDRPAASMDARGNFVLVWHDSRSLPAIRARRYSADGTALGFDFKVNTTGVGINPRIAMDAAGDFVVIWITSDGDDSGIRGQRYNADGTAAGGEFLVNTTTAGSQNSPDVAMDAAGDFAVTWTDPVNVIFARRFDSSGAPVSDQVQVSPAGDTKPFAPCIALDPSGDYVVAWMNTSMEGSELHAQRYGASGDAQGDQLTISALENGQTCRVAMDATGGFVASWADQTASVPVVTYSVFARRYTADDAAEGDAFRVDSSQTGKQETPAIAMTPDGSFTIAWQGPRADGNSWNVYAQDYDSDGIAQGGNFPVDTEMTLDQESPAVALSAAGDGVIAWQNEDPSAFDLDIRAQRYHRTSALDLSAGLVPSPSVRVVTPGSTVVLTVSIINSTPVSTLTGIGTVDSAITMAAAGTASTITLPKTVSFISAAGTDWSCGTLAKQALTCTYDATLDAGDVSSALTVTVRAAFDPAVMDFTNTISGAQMDSDSSNDSITVEDATTADMPPEAEARTLAVNRNTSKSGSLLGRDPDKDKLTYTVIKSPKHGNVSLGNGRAYFYQPARNYSGKDSFTYIVRDGIFASASATVSITVTEHTPVAIGGSSIGKHNTGFSGRVKATDADAGDILRFITVSAPKHGAFDLIDTGLWVYQPKANYKGKDSFTFHVNDGSKISNTATVSITVN